MELLDASCNHHGIRSFVGCGIASDSSAFFVVGSMSHGVLLTDVLNYNAPLWEQRISWLVDIITAVSYLHHQGFLHGNLRSCNIWTSACIDGSSKQSRAVIDLPYVVAYMHRASDTSPGWRRALDNPAILPFLAPELLTQAMPKDTHSASESPHLASRSRAGSARPKIPSDIFSTSASQSNLKMSQQNPMNLFAPSFPSTARRVISARTPIITGPTTRFLPEDVYAIGMIAYECLALKKPWSRESGRTRAQVRSRVDTFAKVASSKFRILSAEESNQLQKYQSNNIRNPSTSDSIPRKVVDGKRPRIPANMADKAPNGFVSIIQACWRQNPFFRPSIVKLRRNLNNIQSQLTMRPPKSLDYACKSLLPK